MDVNIVHQPGLKLQREVASLGDSTLGAMLLTPGSRNCNLPVISAARILCYTIGMKLTTINNLKTCYYIAGQDSRHILFLHGWAASGRMWLRSMWALRRDYRMWAPDLPGFGDSYGPNIEWYSIERYTDHVIAFCEELGIRPYAVIGHSMGGRVTLDLARRYPDLVERVVAVSPTVTGRLGFNLDVFMMGGVGEMMMGLSRRVWPFATAGAMSMYWAPRYLGTEVIKRTAADLRRSTWRASIGSLRAVINQDYSPHLSDIQHPTLLICGKRDYTVPPDDSRIAAQHLPNAQLVMLDHVHHLPMDEAPQIYLDAVRSFLVNGHLEAVR